MIAPRWRRGQRSGFDNISVFFTFAIIVVATNLILSSAMYVNYKRHSVNLVQSYSVEELSQVSYSMSFMFEAAKLTLLQLYANPAVLKLMNADGLGELETADLLRQVSTPNGGYMDFVNSIYIYNKKTSRMYVEDKAFILSDFPDREMVGLLETAGSLRNLRPMARQVRLSAGDSGRYGALNAFQTRDVYTFVFYDSYSQEIDSAIILNVSQEWMQQTVEAMNPETVGDTIIVDDRGRIALGNEHFQYLQNIDQYIGEDSSLFADVPSGYTVRSLNGSKYLISYVSSGTGWNFIRLTPYEVLSGKLSRMLMLTLMISVLVSLLAVVAVMFSSRKIHRLFNKRMNELLGRYEKEKTHGYEKKQQFLFHLAMSKMEESALHKGFRQFGIPFDLEQRFFTLAFKVDDYRQYCSKFTKADRALFSYGMINIMDELAGSEWRQASVDLGEGVIGMVFHVSAEEFEALNVKIEQLAKRIQSNIEQYLAVSLSVSIGDLLDEVADVPESFAQHAETLSYKLFYGSKVLLYISRIKELKRKEYGIPETDIAKLLENVRRGDRSAVQAACMRLLESVNGYAMTFLLTLLLHLAMSVREFMKKYEIADDGSIYLQFIDVAKEAAHNESLEDIAGQLEACFSILLDKLASKQEQVRSRDRYSEMIRRVQETIEAEMANPNLSPDLLAEQLGITGKYLRTIYKKVTGDSLTESINLSRMDKAKRLLLHTDLSVQEVAFNSGFVNINYFYTLFKKYHGVTPNEFRGTIA